MTDEQMKLNEELEKLKQEFMIKHGISCNTCCHKKKNGKCESKVYCIARDNVFFSAYQKAPKVKAVTNIIKWHDLLKDSTDIPIMKDDIYSIEVWAVDKKGRYGSAVFSYALFKEDGKFTHWIGINPIAWCEFPKFEEVMKK